MRQTEDEKTIKFRRHIEPLFRDMYNAAYRLTGKPEDAEDLIQETFIKAFRYIDRFDGSANPAAWVYTIMKNTFLNDLRYKKHRETAALDENAVDRLATEDTYPEEEPGDLQALLNNMPQDMKTILIAREINGLSYHEISESMNLPVGTVKSRIARARDTLREKWLRMKKIGGS